MSSSGTGKGENVGGLMGASIHAHELSRRRVLTNASTPTTPVTPVIAPNTPTLAAHIFAEGNILEDLQLAAELGKTLLERNKELEWTIKEQRSTIEDRTQEIEYLSKQTAALREVNDSRLRIYEQLEISIQELEKSNQRLTAETSSDKKKIKSLSVTVEQLETKCEELQRSLEEAKAFQQKQQHQKQQQKDNRNHSNPHQEQQHQNERGRPLSRRPLAAVEENAVSCRRSISCENNAQPCCEELSSEYYELKVELGLLRAKLEQSEREGRAETNRREEMEIELSCCAQENAGLQEQLLALKEKESVPRSLEDELASLDDTASSSKFCGKCMGLADETASNLTVQDFADDIEDMDAYDNIQGECALVRLKNGGYAWGSQESLASMGQVVNCVGSSGSSPRADALSDAPHNSLLNELDTQYRILIEKYEALVEAREDRKEQSPPPPPPPQTQVDSGVDEVSGPMSLVMTEMSHHDQAVNASLRCLRCTTCSCDLKPVRPKSNMEELSEVETSSSGFSEGECRFYTKMTQTEIIEMNSYYKESGEDATTPTPFGCNFRYLDLHTPMNPCEMRFQSKPQYRKLFHEIFEVLKKDVKEVDKHKENKVKLAVTRTLMHTDDPAKVVCQGNHETDEETATDISSEICLRDENEENKSPNVGFKENEDVKIDVNNAHEEGTERLKESPQGDLKDLIGCAKLVRPDFLDLDTASTCSSRSRRRKKSRKNKQIQPNSPQEQKQQQVQQKEQQQKQKQQKKKKSESESASANKVSHSTLNSSSPPSNGASVPEAVPVSTDAASQLKETTSYKPQESSSKPASSNTSKGRCEHKSRKNKHKVKLQPLQNKHLSRVLSRHSPSPSPKQQQQYSWSVHHNNTASTAAAKSTLPSVQVAKLIRFEKSYAEVLKTADRRDQKFS